MEDNKEIVLIEMYYHEEEKTYEYKLGNCRIAAPITSDDVTFNTITAKAPDVVRQIGLVAKFAHIAHAHTPNSDILIDSGMLAAIFARLDINSISGKPYTVGSGRGGLRSTIKAAIRFYEKHATNSDDEKEQVVATNMAKYIKRYLGV